ncbi:MAG: AraC family transcriptional regulator [Synechococcales cyanobacterium M58_A2018_015]|nr:AraC family transcriptional regulator [Synechococcales cyanobacterium M58_A2018_015]
MTVTDCSVEIALVCGCNSQSYLSQTFRQLTGISPNTYRAASRTP